jgi:hypothetical protein
VTANLNDLQQWLTARWPADLNGVTVPYPMGWHRGDQELPKMPDRLVALSWNAGPGLLNDGTLVARIFAVLVRGRASLPGEDDAAYRHSGDALMQAADAAALADAPHERIGGLVVVSCEQAGGTPSFLRRDAQRVVMACSYVLTMERTPSPRATAVPGAVAGLVPS